MYRLNKKYLRVDPVLVMLLNRPLTKVVRLPRYIFGLTFPCIVPKNSQLRSQFYSSGCIVRSRSEFWGR
jgi:hypothetical protein